MTVSVLASAKHSPGVTTTAVAVASGWPGSTPVVLVEADVAGGDLLCWYGHHAVGDGCLVAEPGVASLAVAGRRVVTAELVLEACQPLPGNGSVRALVAPVAAEQADAALSALVLAGLGEALASVTGHDVIVDVGRLHPSSPTVELLARADAVVLVARPTASDVVHLQAAVAALGQRADLSLVLVGERPYTAAEVSAAVGVPVAAVMPNDPRGAQSLTGQGSGRRGASRSLLSGSGRELAATLASGEVGAQAAAARAQAAASPAHRDRTKAWLA